MKQQILDSTCACINYALDHERQKGFNYQSAFDGCMTKMKTRLLKMDKKYSNDNEISSFITIELKKNCAHYYRGELMRSTLASNMYKEVGNLKDSIPPSNKVWFHYSGNSDAGSNMDVMIRFISIDSLEFIAQLNCVRCEDSCDIYTNDIARYKKGSKFWLKLKQPRRANRLYEYNRPDEWIDLRDRRRSEVIFHFPDHSDLAKGIYVELVCDRTPGDKVYNTCKQDALETPLKFKGTMPDTINSPYRQKQAILKSACACFGKAVDAEKNTKFDFEFNYEICVDSLSKQLKRYNPQYNDHKKVERFMYIDLGYYCKCYHETDSLERNYSVHSFKPIVSISDCTIMNSGVFMEYGDTDSAMIYMSKKKQTIKYKDGTYTKSKIEWQDDCSFKIIRVKSTNATDSKNEPGSEMVIKILKVMNKNIVSCLSILNFTKFI